MKLSSSFRQDTLQIIVNDNKSKTFKELIPTSNVGKFLLTNIWLKNKRIFQIQQSGITKYHIGFSLPSVVHMESC